MWVDDLVQEVLAPVGRRRNKLYQYVTPQKLATVMRLSDCEPDTLTKVFKMPPSTAKAYSSAAYAVIGMAVSIPNLLK